MAVKKVWLGSIGPHQYDDTDLINDTDGDLPGRTHAGISTTGQMHVLESPSQSDHVARYGDVQTSILNAHVQNSDTMLASGTVDQVTALELRTFLNNASTPVTIAATATGFTTSPIAFNITGYRLGKMSVMAIPAITGTSNLNDFTITIPVAWRAFTGTNFIARIQDNGIDAFGYILITTITTIRVFPSSTSTTTAWTASGTKTLRAMTITYINL